MYILSFNVGCDKCVSCLESGDVRMSGDDHLSLVSPGLHCPVLIYCQPNTISVKIWLRKSLWICETILSLILRLVLLTINVVQDIYCKFSRYPWSLNVCTKFDNVFIWWKVSGMFLFHDSEYELILVWNNRLNWTGGLSEMDQGPLAQLTRVTSPRPGHFPPNISIISGSGLATAPLWLQRSLTTELTTHAVNINFTRFRRNC